LCFAPKVYISWCESLSLSGGEFLGYERIYAQSGELPHLYNVINAAARAGKDKKELSYIKLLQSDEEYASFCEKMDASARSAAKKQYVAYVGSLDSFLNNERVSILFSRSLSKARDAALLDLSNSNKYSFALDTFLSKAQRSKTADEQLAKVLAYESENKSIFQLLDARVALLEYSSLEGAERILSVYTLMKIEKARYTLYNFSGMETERDQAKINFENLQNEYASLIS